LLICFTASQKLDAAVYSYEFFYGQEIDGQPITSSYFFSLSNNGYAAGRLGVTSQGGGESSKLALFQPNLGLSVLKEPYYSFAYVNDSGSVVWTEYDFINGINYNYNYLYSDGFIKSLNFDPGYASITGFNNNNEILGQLQTGLSADPDTRLLNFIYHNDQITYLPTIPEARLLATGERCFSDNGLALFYVEPDDGGSGYNVIHKIGTLDFFTLQDESSNAAYTFDMGTVSVTPGGKIYRNLEDYDIDFNPLGGRFLVYNQDGSIQSSIPKPPGAFAVINDKNDILASSSGQIIRWDGSQWRPIANLNLPDGAYLDLRSFNSQGRFVGMAYNVPGDLGYGVAFYATPVPEPASAVVLGSLLVGLGLRTYRTSGASRKTIGT